MDFGQILVAALMQVLFWVGAVILTGVIIACLNTLFYRFVGTKSHAVCVATAVIGTPIHELGHAFFCLVFGHKITEIKLFQASSNDGTLGYVTHSYNPKNIYQKIGQFFIGVGPIIFGSGVLLLLLFLLVRPAFASLASAMNLLSGGAYTTTEYFSLIGKSFRGFFRTMFAAKNLKAWTWWVMLILGCMIALHMRLSKPDIEGAKLGLILVIAIFAIVPIIVGVISMKAMRVVTGAMTSAAIYVMCVYLLAIMFAMISVLVALVIRLLITAINKLLHRK